MKKIFTILGVVALGFTSSAQVVINEVYGAGGNAGATVQNDYIELKNIGTTDVSLNGYTLQYASTTGTFNSYQSLPNVILPAGKTFLIQEASGGAVGVALPTADFAPTTNTNTTTGVVYNNAFNMAATGGKVALANSTAAVTGPTATNVVDFVGWGAATLYEGSGAAPASTTTASVSRISGDTNDNKTDFAAGALTPTNMAGQTLGVSDINAVKANFVKNTMVTNEITFGTKANVKVYNMNGQLVKTASVEKGGTLNVSSLSKGTYIVSGEVEGQNVAQKIIKQ